MSSISALEAEVRPGSGLQPLEVDKGKTVPLLKGGRASTHFFYDWTREDWAASGVGMILGTALSLVTVQAVMKAGIAPGFSQVVMVLSYFLVFKLGCLKKCHLWNGLSKEKRARYLCIVQSTGSASASLTLALGSAIPAGFMLAFRQNPVDQTWTDLHAKLNLTYILKIVLAMVGGSLTGAAYTNINMAKSLEEEYPMPEAHASASLIRTYATDDAEDDQSAQVENGSGGSSDTKVTEAWMQEGLMIPCATGLLISVLGWVGILPNGLKWNRPTKTEQEAGLRSPTGTAVAFRRDFVDGITGRGVPNVMDMYRSTRKASDILVCIASDGCLYAGIGTLLSVRSCFAMLLGAITYLAVNEVVCTQIASLMEPDAWSELIHKADNKTVAAIYMSTETEKMWGNGNAYKVVGVFAILVNTAWVMIQMVMKHTSKPESKGPAAKVNPLTERPGWTTRFNMVCLTLGYAVQLYLIIDMPLGIGWKVGLFLMSMGCDYILNFIGGIQSLTVGASASPVSACLISAGLMLGFFRSKEVCADPTNIKECEQGAHLTFGLWIMRMFTSVCFTNDAAQDYATTKILGQNMYIATRQNLMAALISSMTLPFAFYYYTAIQNDKNQFAFGSKDGLRANGLKCGQGDTLATIVEGMMKGSIALYPALIGCFFGVVATYVENLGNAKKTVFKKDPWYVKAFEGFSCTSFALGMYLGTDTAIGCFVSSCVVELAMQLFGVRGREKNKELYLVAVALIASNAFSGLIASLYTVLQTFVQKSALSQKLPEAPFWGFPSNYNSLRLEKLFNLTPMPATNGENGDDSHTGLGIEALVTLVCILAIVFNSAFHGNEMEMVEPLRPSNSGTDTVDDDKLSEIDAQLEYLTRTQIEINSQKNTRGRIVPDASDAEELKRQIRELEVKKAEVERLSDKSNQFTEYFVGQIQQQGWKLRNKKPSDKQAVSRWIGLTIILAVLIVAAAAVLHTMKGEKESGFILFPNMPTSTTEETMGSPQ